METNDLTPELLRDLRATRPYPALSLTAPTHRAQSLDAQQDAVLLRKLAAEAERRLEEDPEVPRQARFDVTEQLRQALTEVNPRESLDGLVIFADSTEHQLWTLPRTVPARVVLSDSYLTRNLVAAKAQASPFWVLAVSADLATLWAGSGDSLHEPEVGGFPHKPDRPDYDPQREERIGDTPSTFRDDDTRRFLREVDGALAGVLRTHPYPLFLAGLAPGLALLDEAGTAVRSAVGRAVKGGLENGPGHELLAEVRPELDDYLRRQARAVRDRLGEARGQRRFAAGLDEIWGAVREGRVGMLAVEEHYQTTQRIRNAHLEPVPAGGEPGEWPEVREDIVDEIVEGALDTDAEVVFLPDDTLAEDTGRDRVAAVLRY